MLNVMSINVRRGVKRDDAMWNDGVVHVEYGGVLCCDARCDVVVEYRVMWNEWFDAILDMVGCVLCGLECAVE